MESSAGAAAVLQYMYRRFCRRFPYLEKVYPSDHTVNGFLRSVQRLGSLVVIDPEMMHLAAQEMAVDPVEADGSIVELSTLCRLMPQELLMMASAAV